MRGNPLAFLPRVDFRQNLRHDIRLRHCLADPQDGASSTLKVSYAGWSGSFQAKVSSTHFSAPARSDIHLLGLKRPSQRLNGLMA